MTTLRRMLLFSVVPVLGLAQSGDLTPLVWSSTNSTDCTLPPGYDGCAVLEFCQGPLSSNRIPQFGYRLPGETGCGLWTAPLIRMQVGRKYLIALRNTAAEPTNLHTHGLHVWGDGNGDDVTRSAAPNGGTLYYTYNLIDEHRGGTFWYHSHKHGTTFRHVRGGALGMLIIEDELGHLPQGDVAIQNFATNPQNELLLIAAAINLGEDDTALVYGNAIASPGPSLTVARDTWYRLRILSAAPEARRVSIGLPPGTGDCQARLVAADGIWRSVVPGPIQDVFSATNSGRVDLAVRCSQVGSTSITYAGKTVAQIQVTGDAGNALSSPFDATGSPWESRSNLPTGHYLSDWRQATVDDSFFVRVDRDNINGQAYDETQPLTTIQFEQTHEWTVRDSARHPFHLHIFPFQIVTPGGCGAHEEGEFYDSLATANRGDSCTIRFRATDIAGRIIMHCHVLEHEDRGAMAWMQVVNGPEPDFKYMDGVTEDGGDFERGQGKDETTSSPINPPPPVQLSYKPTANPVPDESESSLINSSGNRQGVNWTMVPFLSSLLYAVLAPHELNWL